MARRRIISVHDYPEHLNPFSEEHQRVNVPQDVKYHTTGRPKRRPAYAAAWDMLTSRKSKPEEANLNSSPRLARSSSFTSAETQTPQPTRRRKFFTDFSWLPRRRRFKSTSQSSSPVTPRRLTPSPARYEDIASQRYRSVSMTRAADDVVYRQAVDEDPPLFTVRTHRYRSPSVSPTEDGRYYMDEHNRPSPGTPPYSSGHYYTEKRYRSTSMSPPTQYSETLYADDLQPGPRSASLSPNGAHYVERLNIDEGERYRPSSISPTHSSDRHAGSGHGPQYLERMYIEDSKSVSPSSSAGRMSPATSPNDERGSPFDDQALTQRPPRPPRTKKRRAPLPPSQTTTRATTPERNMETTDHESIVAEARRIVAAYERNDSTEEINTTKEMESSEAQREFQVLGDEVNENELDDSRMKSENGMNNEVSVVIQEVEVHENGHTTSDNKPVVSNLEVNDFEKEIIDQEAMMPLKELRIIEETDMPYCNHSPDTGTQELTIVNGNYTAMDCDLQERESCEPVQIPVQLTLKPEAKVRTIFGANAVP